MTDSVTKLAEIIRTIPSELLIAVSLGLGGVLFLPEEQSKQLALHVVREEYRAFLGPAFLLMVCWVTTRMLLKLSAAFSSWRHKRRVVQRLHTLTAEEKGYLAAFVLEGRNTINVAPEDGIAGGLMRKGILYRASNMFDLLEGVPFNLQVWAREYLDARQHLLEGASGRPMSPRDRLDDKWDRI